MQSIAKPWIQTYTGRHLVVAAPSPDLICLEDIAHALSRVCRYIGHCAHHYSVAQHSVIVSRLTHGSCALAGLMHDATEAYLGDVSAPLKAYLSEYRAMERAWSSAVVEAFGLPASPCPCIRRADLIALATECRDVMGGERGGDWCLIEDPSPETIIPCSAEEAECAFVSRFFELTGRTEK